MPRMSLLSLGVTDDPGTAWHPRADHPTARDAAGNLRDLTAAEVAEHRTKPETADQVDAAEPLAAEDSTETAPGEV